MKKDAYYFPHFCNARGDRKIKRLMKDLGVEGYGLYFMLLEVLRDQDGFKFPVSDIDLLSDEFRTSEAKLKTVVLNYSLFEVDQDSMFFSPKFNEYMQPYLNMKQQRINAAKKSVESRRKKAEQKTIPAQTTVERPLNGSTNDRITDDETIVKQSKVKKSKVKKINNAQSDELLVSTCFAFEDFWLAYGKKIDKKRCESIYSKLKEADRQKIKDTIDLYVTTHKERQYRKNPQTYLNGRNWEDDLTNVKTADVKQTASTPREKRKFRYN